MQENGTNKGARSYKGQIIGDSMAITINFKWLIQIIVATAMLVYAFWTIESRIQALERDMAVAMEEIKLHEIERLESEKIHVEEIEERLLWYENELNLNPLSWGKRNKKGK